MTDFGIARAGASQMTEEGAIIGTAQYLSPEQARGAPVDQTSDLYSTGIVLFELLTGEVPFTGDSPVEIAMKHLGETPPAPSDLRSDVPDDLDLVVVRALAKEPADRYQSAAAFDADLETVARGGRVAAETAEAATMVLAGERDDATQQRRSRGVPHHRSTSRRSADARSGRGSSRSARSSPCSCWACSSTTRSSGSSKARRPWPSRTSSGLQQANAVNKIEEKGLTPQVRPVSNSDVEEGVVFNQTPTEGTRVDNETVVTIDVSSGKPEVTIPSVVGQTDDDAVAELTRAGLNAQVVEVNSDRDVGTVTAQNPGAGTVVVEGTQVRINVSRGPKPVTVPNVVGLPYDQAASELQRNGFSVSRIDEESDQAAGIVTSQTPSGGSEGSKGSTVTVTVSKGPSTSAVPDVTTQDFAIAQTTLEAAGFRTRVVFEDTDDPTFDGIVISQDPVGGTQAKPNALITLFVGRFVSTTTTTP